MKYQLLLPALFLFATSWLSAETSRVLHLKIENLVFDRYDAHIWVHHRDDEFHHGYVTLAERDNLVHRIDLTPTPAIRFVDANGDEVITPKGMRGNYSYKNEAFPTFKAQYASGDLRIERDELPPFLVKGNQVTGVLDILIHEIDAANAAGRNNHDLTYRINIQDLKLGKAGEITAWQYPPREDSKGADTPRMKKRATASWMKDAWDPATDARFAPGTEWPSAHGPFLTGSAIPHDGELINTLHDAELVWVAEDILPSGRSGGKTRGGFAMFPFEWTTIGYGGYGAPIVADDKVFVFVQTSDTSSYEGTPELENNAFVRLGIDPRAMADVFNTFRDSVYCFDALTGKRLWVHHGEGGKLSRNSKSGMASTPVFHEGKVYVRGRSGLYALNADNGERLWLKGGSDGVGYGIGSAPDEGSVVMVDGVLILMNKGHRDKPSHTAGIDPATGDLLWKLDAFGGSSIGLPGVFRKGKETLLILPRTLVKKSKRTPASEDGVAFVLPKTGEIVTEHNVMGGADGQVIVSGNRLIGNGVLGLAEEPKKSKKAPLLGGARIGKNLTLEKEWTHEAAPLPGSRTLGVLHDEVYYSFSRAGAFGIDITTGETLAKKGHIYHYTGGSHNWTWHVATNDRIITSGLGMMRTADQGMDFLPGRLSLDITSGYRAPTKPAISDGRIFLRLSDKLVCYDLRKKAHHEDTQVLELTCEAAFPGIQEGQPDDAILRVRIREDAITGVTANWAKVSGPERQQVASWLGEDGHLPWRRSNGEGFDLSNDGLKGTSTVRISYMEEPWELDLTRKGDTFSGTYIRTIQGIQNPVEAKGEVMGQILLQEETEKVWNMYLTGSMTNQLQTGTADGAISIVVVTDPEDRILRAWAFGGRINRVAHEVDASKLSVKGNQLKGEATVLFRDDNFITLNPDASAAQYRKSAHASGVAATYTLSVQETDGKLSGSHTGTIGHPWTITGNASGKLAAEEHVLGLK